MKNNKDLTNTSPIKLSINIQKSPSKIKKDKSTATIATNQEGFKLDKDNPQRKSSNTYLNTNNTESKAEVKEEIPSAPQSTQSANINVNFHMKT